MRVHFVGIAGAGMHSLALYLSELGHDVSGSDVRMDEKRRAFWENRGVRVYDHQAAENIDGADLVVFSSAIRRDNPERAAAEALGIAQSRGEVLARFANAHPFSIAVCGTHGKGTTAGAISFILSMVGRRVSHILGAVPIGDSEPCICIPGAEFLVSEVDESDKTHIHHVPKLLLINNVEADHLDVYGDLESIVDSFESHVRRVLSAGTRVVIHYAGVGAGLLYERLNDCASIYWIAPDGVDSPVRSPDLAYEIGEPDAAGDCLVTVRDAGGKVCRFLPALGGRANAQNLISAIGVAIVCGVEMRQAASVLPRYKGLCDRCEVRRTGAVWLATDYATHPTCVSNDIAWLRRRARRIIAVYHPYRYSLMAHHWDLLCHALSAADAVYLLPLDSGGECEVAGISSASMALGVNAIREGCARAFESCDALFDALARAVQADDLVVVFSGGKVFQKALSALEK